jgi:hypothetical protein
MSDGGGLTPPPFFFDGTRRPKLIKGWSHSVDTDWLKCGHRSELSYLTDVYQRARLLP